MQEGYYKNDRGQITTKQDFPHEQCRTCAKLGVYCKIWVCWETYFEGLLPAENKNNNCNKYQADERE